jgi:cytochrome c-type biogenesis protein CcmH
LQRQLLDDTAAAEAVATVDAVTAARVSRSPSLLPLFAVALYAVLGTPSAVLPQEAQAQRVAADMEQLTANLARKLEQDPENPEGWVMLARDPTSPWPLG